MKQKRAKRRKPLRSHIKGQWRINAYDTSQLHHYGWMDLKEEHVAKITLHNALTFKPDTTTLRGDCYWSPSDCSTSDALDQFLQMNVRDQMPQSIEYVLKGPFPSHGCMLFHGTTPKNAKGIMRRGFLASKRGSANGQSFGEGDYFTPFITIARRYGNSIIVCQVLSGHEDAENQVFVCSNTKHEIVRALLQF